MKEKKLKIITLNLLYGGLFFDNILSFLKKEQPDILTLQEVYNGQDPTLPQNFRSISVLQNHLPGYYYRFAPQFLDHRNEGVFEIGNATFSRYPIVGGKTVFYDIPYDANYNEEEKNGDYSNDPCNVLHVKINYNSSFINIFNTHGVWGFEGRDNERRFHMSKVLIDCIKDEKNIILAGDFNVNPDTKAMENLEKYLVNPFKGELTSTFNMKHKTNPGYATAVVDMIYLDKSMKVISKTCPDVDVSDHYPLIATVTF